MLRAANTKLKNELNRQIEKIEIQDLEFIELEKEHEDLREKYENLHRYSESMKKQRV